VEQTAVATLLKMTAYPTLTRLKLKPSLWPWEARHLQWLGQRARAAAALAGAGSQLAARRRRLPAAAEQLPGLQRLVVGHSFFYFEVTRGLDGRLSALHLHFSAVTQNASYLPQLSTPLRLLPTTR